MIPAPYYLTLNVLLFVIGIVGLLLNRRSLLAQLMAVELILLSVSMNFVTFSYFLSSDVGQIFVIFILTVAAAESALGLAILVCLYKKFLSVDLTDLNHLKGE